MPWPTGKCGGEEGDRGMAIESNWHPGEGPATEEQPRRKVGVLRRLRERVREDIQAVYKRDPAARSLWEVLTCYPGLHAIWLHRVAHGLWRRRHLTLARFLSHWNRFLTGIEIHPGARIGRRLFIDHGAGVVIGETAEVGDDVLMYTGVILGGTTSEHTKRHPTIGNAVVLGSHAIVLGNITVGDGAKVGSGSVVVQPVPSGATVVGVPGRVVRVDGRRTESQAQEMLEHGRLPDPVVETLKCLVERVEYLESRLRLMAEPSPAGLEEFVPVDCMPQRKGKKAE
jgi:serine O-acetyltransferase